MRQQEGRQEPKSRKATPWVGQNPFRGISETPQDHALESTTADGAPTAKLGAYLQNDVSADFNSPSVHQSLLQYVSAFQSRKGFI